MFRLWVPIEVRFRDLDARVAALAAAMRSLNLHRRGRLEKMTEALQALSPLAILDRGYALVFDASGKLLKDARDAKAGQDITARLARGELRATVLPAIVFPAKVKKP